MPRVKDITHDLGKLRDRKVLPTGTAPLPPQVRRLERQPAFNAPSVFIWICLSFFLALQAVFLLWLAA